MQPQQSLVHLIEEHNSLFSRLSEIGLQIIKAAEVLTEALKAQNKILVCGNGGSAADAQHLAAEIVGRFEKERMALPAIALTTDTSILTAVGNDYGYNTVFSRQVEGLGVAGDTLVGISTSGNSPNVEAAIEVARQKGITTIGLLGKDGGAIAPKCDISVIIPHTVTARIQEAHIFLIHFWAAHLEGTLFPD